MRFDITSNSTKYAHWYELGIRINGNGIFIAVFKWTLSLWAGE